MTNGTVVSGLPLLIVRGKFVNIDVMTLPDLEIFIPFMIKCSINRAKTRMNHNIPVWWPQNVPYKLPLKKPNGLSETGWKMHLRNLVIRCYFFHKAQYLLTFCGKIASEPGTVRLEQNNNNKTIALYLEPHPMPILTFDNENMTYDLLTKKTDRPTRRSLLPSSPVKTSNIIDVYLCENCDSEFSSQNDMKKHENECFSSNHSVGITKKDTTSSNDDNSLIDLSNQNQFLNYFNLIPSTSTSNCLNQSTSNGSLGKRWVNANECLSKNRAVEFSSMYGRKLLQNNVRRDRVQKMEKLISTYDVCCGTSNIRTYEMRMETFSRRIKLRSKQKQNNNRTYSFNKRQRLERCREIETGLNRNARRLKRSCKDCSVVLNKLDQRIIDSYRSKETVSIAVTEATSPIVAVTEATSPVVAVTEPTSTIVAVTSSSETTTSISTKEEPTEGTKLFTTQSASQLNQIISDNDVFNMEDKENITCTPEFPFLTKCIANNNNIIVNNNPVVSKKPVNKPLNNTVVVIDLCSSDEES